MAHLDHPEATLWYMWGLQQSRGSPLCQHLFKQTHNDKQSELTLNEVIKKKPQVTHLPQ